MNSLDQLITAISRLPGLGRKSATRISHHLLQRDPADAKLLADLLEHLHERIRRCSICGSYTESDPCDVCTDHSRDRSTVCVVEQPADVSVMERSGEYHGIYHVLGGVIAPIDGVGPADLSIHSLMTRVKNEPISEVILATNPTVEGDTTALYLAKQLEDAGIEISRLALGLPVGGDLEYADRLTLARSLRGRTSLRLVE